MERRIFGGLGVAIVLVAGCGRLAQHPVARQALDEVRTNTRVAEALGGTVQCGTVRGTVNETDGIAHLEFEALGARGRGLVIVEGKKTRDEWGVTMLELRPAGADKFSLTADLEARTGTDTPTFDPRTAKTGTSAPAKPPEDIDIVLPPPPPGQ